MTEVKPFQRDILFTARGIAKVEAITKLSIAEALGDLRMTNLARFISAGCNVGYEKSLDMIDTYFNDGGDLGGLYVLVMRELKKRGFLPKTIDIEEMEAALINPDPLETSKPLSPQSGKQENPPLSE